MKRQYYRSMLSIALLIMIFDCIYLAFHRSLEIFVMLGLLHLVLFGLLNFLGAYFLYKPVDRLFSADGDAKAAQARIGRLAGHSAAWIFILGAAFNVMAQLPLIFNPALYGDIEVFSVEKMPLFYILSGMPATLFVFAVLPAFIAYFLINDFSLDLKTKVFEQFQIVYPAGKKRIGMTLLGVFLILVVIPVLLTLLELAVALGMGDQFAQFSSLSPLETVMIDRLVVLVGMIIALVFLTRAFTKPLHSLLGQINKVQGGNYAARAAVITRDEISVLTENFNEMIRQLELSHQQLAEINRTLEKKVAERTRELQQKNTELADTLEQLTQMQKQLIVQEKMASLGQLVAGLTHEFNTPIGALRSMQDTKSKALRRLQAALANETSGAGDKNSEIGKMLGIVSNADQLIDQSAARLHEIIQNLKTFARLDEAESAKADIHQGLESVLVLLGHELLNNIEVVREYGEIPPFVHQPRKLNQVFYNILKNACQAIDGKGRITITTRLEEGQARVAIRDTGRGIPPEALDTIFDPQFTAKSSVVRARLGLSTSYQIIQAHHGRIAVESQPGKGAVFTVTIPAEFRGDGSSNM